MFGCPSTDGQRPVLQDISFEVESRRRSSVSSGGSGVGKTTLLRVLGGLLEATLGHSRFRR